MSFVLGNKSKQNLAGVNLVLVDVVQLALTISVIDFGIPADGGIRTAERQKELFDAKKSKADGYVKKRKHQSGNASDVYAFVDGQASWDEKHLALVAAAILQAANQLGVHLVWGGLWKGFRDMPHFEIKERK